MGANLKIYYWLTLMAVPMKYIRLIISYYRLASRIVLVLLILTPAHGWGLEDKIVFVSKRNFTPEVFLVDGLNGRPIQLTRNMFVNWPSIAPDGTEVVFVSRPPGEISNIFKLHIPTRKIEKLTDNDVRDIRYTDLDWSPDGRQILFIKHLRILDSKPEKTDLCVMDMKTRDIRHILQPQRPTSIFHPSWSPDSQHVLYLQVSELRKDSGLYIPTLFITDDNGNNVVEVKRDNFGIRPEWLSPVAVPTWSPSRGHIAYLNFIATVQHPPNPFQIYSMNLDDGMVTAVTSGDAENRFPAAWHPDGRRILLTISSPYHHHKVQSADIYVMDPDGENMINLTQSPEREVAGSWSPDGKQIVFSRWLNNGDVAIFVMDANGQNQQRLTFESGINYAPHWSPDGDRIAFQSDRDGALRIYTMDTNGQNVQQITHRQRTIDGGPAWSPDGKWLAFGSGDRGSWGIYLIDPQGRNETRIFHSNVSELDFLATSHPAWSPDSQHLVCIDPWREGDVGLIKIRVDGGLPTPLSTEGLSPLWGPAWSPDGNSLLFGAQENRGPIVINNEVAIILMNLDTSESRHFTLPGIFELLLESDFSLLRLVWAPDGSQLMLSIGQKGADTPQENRLYLIDIASETIRLWMDDAGEADWVRPGFVYAVNPRGKRISTWALMKTRGDTNAQVNP